MLCKHIWATLLKAEDSHSDFLEGKNEISLGEISPLSAEHERPGHTKRSKTVKPDPTEAQTAFKKKQKDYQKQNYEKQKQRAKEFKASKKKALPSQIPPTLEKAFHYFSKNGFPMETNLSLESLALAKKKLSRIFHPDLGGSHEEILELNRNLGELAKHLATKN
jgi:hypothetical protein